MDMNMGPDGMEYPLLGGPPAAGPGGAASQQRWLAFRPDTSYIWKCGLLQTDCLTINLKCWGEPPERRRERLQDYNNAARG